MSQRIGPGISATAAGPAGSHRWFPGGPGAFCPKGGPGGWIPPERRAGRVPMGGLTVRGPTMRLLVRGPHVLPEPSLAFPRGPALLIPRAHAALSLKPTLLSPSLPCFWLRPAPAFSAASRPSPPSARALLRSPRSRQRSRGCDLAGRKRAFACGVPGALLGTWVSPTRFDEDERPVSRERLDMRGTHSHEASSWARGYYAE